MYSYAKVEGALAHIFHVAPERRGALRGRIKHFQKIGLTLWHPGKGKKIAYVIADAFLWALAIELCEFGIDPTAAGKMLSADLWSGLPGDIERYGIEEFEYLIFYPSVNFPFYRHLEGRTPPFFAKDKEALTKLLARDVEAGDTFDRRLGVIHLGQLWRELVRALDSPF